MHPFKVVSVLLIVLGTLYLGPGRWASTGQGDPDTAYEALRRYEISLHTQAPAQSVLEAEKLLTLTAQETRWPPHKLAQLEHHVAGQFDLIGAKQTASAHARQAQNHSLNGDHLDLAMMVDIASRRADIAFSLGDEIDAACAWGLLLERLGIERTVDRPNDGVVHPELLRLSEKLLTEARRFGSQPGASAPVTPENLRTYPITTCHLLAKFYAEHELWEPAAIVSDLVNAAARASADIGPFIRAALLTDAARYNENRGDVQQAEHRLREAIHIVEKTGNKTALIVALDRLLELLSSWGDTDQTLPILKRTIELREAQVNSPPKSFLEPLILLGYTYLDKGDSSAAEKTFRRALAIAETEDGKNAPLALESLLALRDIYEDEKKPLLLNQTKAQIDQIYASDAFDEGLPVWGKEAQPSALKPALVVSISFIAQGRPSGGRAATAFSKPSITSAKGQIRIAFNQEIFDTANDWQSLWGPDAFEAARDDLHDPAIFKPQSDAWGLTSETPVLVYVPAQSSRFDAAAARAGLIQAMLGPSHHVILGYRPGYGFALGYTPNRRSDAKSTLFLAQLLSTLIENKNDKAINLIIEGRAADRMAEAINDLPAPARAALNERLASVVLLAPGGTMHSIEAWDTLTQDVSATLTVYGTEKLVPLKFIEEVYGRDVVGLNIDALEPSNTFEMVLVPQKNDGDFRSLMSPGLARDLAAKIGRRKPAEGRCGLVPGTREEIWIFDPSGCRTTADLEPTNHGG